MVVNILVRQECKPPLGGFFSFLKIQKSFKGSSQDPLVTLSESNFTQIIFQGLWSLLL